MRSMISELQSPTYSKYELARQRKMNVIANNKQCQQCARHQSYLHIRFFGVVDQLSHGYSAVNVIRSTSLGEQLLIDTGPHSMSYSLASNENTEGQGGRDGM